QVAALGHHDRVQHHVGRLPPGQFLGHYQGDRLLAQHADLDGVDMHVGEHGVDLLADEGGRHRRDARDALGVLGRERGHYGAAVGAQRAHGLDVGQHPGAARGVHPGNAESVGNTSPALWRQDRPVHFGAPVIRPSVGELGAPLYSLRGMRPARNASRPASTAFFMAAAISSGSCAAAMAVFISTPSQPSSMAMAASDAVPTPASTSTGTRAWSMIRRRFQGLRMPMPEPISEASGMTATTPRSSSMRHWIGSSVQYTMTLKPSATRVLAACSVSGMLGNRLSLSPSTSSFTRLWPSSSSRAKRRVRTASCAV